MANPHFANGNPNGPIMMTVPTNPGQVNLAILDIIHTNLESQLNPLNEKRVMSFHADARNIIGANGCAALVQRFNSILGEPTRILRDFYSGLYMLGPFSAFDDGDTFVHQGEHYWTGPLPKKYPTTVFVDNADGSKTHIPRPPNAYILFRKARHPFLKALNPDMHNNEISVVLGGEWRELSMEAKKVWYDQAAFIKKKMLEEFPDYKYAPRRREQLKRRPGRKFAKKSVKKAANDEMDTASEILEAN